MTMTVAQASGKRFHRRSARAGLAALALVSLAGCSHFGLHIKHHRPIPGQSAMAPSNVTAIGVNAYLWRASLDTLSFMPLAQTDSLGGIIVTDWYANPGNPGERMKLTVAILDKDLRADGLRVTAARQVAQGGFWVDAPVQAATVQRLEDAILTRARDLRRDSAIH